MYSSEVKNDIQLSAYKNDEKFFRYLKKFDNVPGLLTLNESEEELKSNGISKSSVKNEAGETFEVFTFDFPAGFIVIKNYLSFDRQVELALMSLNEFVGELIRKAA